jgi:hypothetical protein
MNVDTVIVSMRCGGSGRPFRVVFESRGPGAPYVIRDISAGSGITVTPASVGQLLTSGDATPTTVDPQLVDADALDWSALRCPFCEIHAGPTRCPSCRSLMCIAAALPADRRLAFLCPVCDYKSRGGKLTGLGRLLAGRLRRRPRPLQLQAKDVTALPAAHALLGTARRLLLGPKREPPE